MRIPAPDQNVSTKKWTVPDLVDFEYFLSSTDASMEQQDRRIFLEAVKPRLAGQPPWSTPQRRSALRLWLEERRASFRLQEPQAVLPGEVFRESRSILLMIVAAFGLLSGGAVALPLLIYTGKSAVNVTMYLGVLVFLQILSLLVMLRFLFFKTSMGSLKKRSLLYLLLGRLFERISAMVARGVADRTEIRAASGPLRGMYAIYGQILFWPFFAAVQLFGIMFNAGAIGATLIRVFTSDLAFGWQSTLQMSPEAVHTLIRTLAIPWTWLLGLHAYPSLAQIEGSRMFLKEGIASLATGNLVAWWPFLVSAVACYGLLPRVALWLASVAGERWALARVRFTHAGCEQLILRMQSPGISMDGAPDGSPSLNPAPVTPASTETMFLALTDAAVLLPEDIIGRCDSDELDRHLAVRLGLKRTELLPVSGSITRDGPTIEKAAAQGHNDGERAVILVQEAWLPPIAETVELIEKIRSCGGRTMRITVLLIGKPTQGTILTPVKSGDKAMWNKALAGLADPYLSVATAGDA